MRISGILLGAALLAAASPAHGQVAVELRGGGAIGNHVPAAAGLGTQPGPSISGALEYGVRPDLSVYGTYTRASFGCEDGFCAGRDVTMTSSGVGAGVRFHPGKLPWVRAGLLLAGTNVDTSTGSSSVDPSLGFELGGGISVPAADRVEIVSGLAMRSGAGDERTTVLNFEVGVRVRLTK
jgi:hypothetical protein